MVSVEKRSPEAGEFFIVEHAEDKLYDILFVGLWASMTDIFMALGIIKNKEANDALVSIAYNEADEELAEGFPP